MLRISHFISLSAEALARYNRHRFTAYGFRLVPDHRQWLEVTRATIQPLKTGDSMLSCFLNHPLYRYGNN